MSPWDGTIEQAIVGSICCVVIVRRYEVDNGYTGRFSCITPGFPDRRGPRQAMIVQADAMQATPSHEAV